MRKAIYPIITMVLILLAGCTFAFRTSVTAMIDIEDEGKVDDIFVFAFFSKDARDNAEKEFINKTTTTADDFDSYLYDCYSIQDELSGIAAAAKAAEINTSILGGSSGIGAVMTIEWETKSPDFGEDYDSPYLYFLAAGADDGYCYIGTCDAKIHSGSSGSVSIRLEKVTNP